MLELDQQRVIGVCDRIIILGMFVFVAASTSSITVTEAGYALAGLAWLVKAVMQRRWPFPRTPVDLPIIAYIGAQALTLAFWPTLGNVEIFIRRLLKIPLIYLFAASVGDERRVKQLVVTLIGGTALVSTWQIAKHLEAYGWFQGRLSVIQHHMTTGELMMMVGVLTSAILLWGVKSWGRLWTGLSFIPVFLALLLTLTRCAWMGFGSGVLTMGILRDKRIIPIFLALLGLGYLLAPQPLKLRAMSILDMEEISHQERFYMWEAGLKMIRDYPIAGVGERGVPPLYPRYKNPKDTYEPGHLHSNFIHLGATLGLVGLGAVLWLLVKIFLTELSIYRSIPEGQGFLKAVVLGCLAVFVGLNVAGLFEWNFGDAEIVMLLWFTLGLCLAIKKVSEKMVVES